MQGHFARASAPRVCSRRRSLTTTTATTTATTTTTTTNNKHNKRSNCNNTSRRRSLRAFGQNCSPQRASDATKFALRPITLLTLWISEGLTPA